MTRRRSSPIRSTRGTTRRRRTWSRERCAFNRPRSEPSPMNLWITLTVNSIAFGGLLFLLSAGFSLIFGLMRIPNLMHGSFFMLGAYFGVTLLAVGANFWVAALTSALAMAIVGGGVERLLLRRLAC